MTPTPRSDSETIIELLRAILNRLEAIAGVELELREIWRRVEQGEWNR